MLRWIGLVAVGALVLGFAVPARAQLPTSGAGGMKLVPVDTTRNLAAPVPTIIQPPRKSLLQRTRDSLSRLNPFSTTPKPTAPQQPTTKMPQQNAQQQPNTGGGGGLSLPKIPNLISGSAR